MAHNEMLAFPKKPSFFKVFFQFRSWFRIAPMGIFSETLKKSYVDGKKYFCLALARVLIRLCKFDIR